MATAIGARGIRRVFRSVLWFYAVSLFAFGVLRWLEVQGASTTPEPTDFNTRYVQHPWVAFGHIVPGVVFVLAAPLQLSRQLRRRNLALHRAVGWMAGGAGAVSAVLAVIFGLLYPWGGLAEQTAAVVFGVYMALALAVGIRAARNHDMTKHRRWMIRAVSVAVGVATIRLVLVATESLGIASFDEAFGWGFWVGLVINAAIAELWLARWPSSPSLR